MITESLQELLARFDRVRVLVIGDAILDEYVTGDCTRLSPEAPIPVLRVRDSRAVPGGAANTAANVAALGGQALLLSALGDDDAGRRLTAELGGLGVVDLSVRDSRATVRKVRALGGQQQLLRLDYEGDGPLDQGVHVAALQNVREHIAGTSVVVVSDYAKGVVSGMFLAEVMALARRAAVPVIVDPRPRNVASYHGADYLTPNWKEARDMVGAVDEATAGVPDPVLAVGRALAARLESNVLLTLGAQGIRYFGRDGESTFHEPARAREVFDVSGAGDTVAAAFALALAAGASERDAVRVANLAAGIVVGKLGTATVSRTELLSGDTGEGRRLLDRTDVERRMRAVREAGGRVAVVVGAFETIHAGTLALLKEARGQADVVLAGLLAGEADVGDRVGLLLALRDVDFVHVARTAEHLEALSPEVLFDERAPYRGRRAP